MGHRLARVRELLKREIGTVLTRDFVFNDALVTVNDVDVTADLRNAHVFLGMVGTSKGKREAMEKIDAQRGMIQQKLAKRVVLKFTPKLHFKQDDSVERGVALVGLIEEVDGMPTAPLEEDDFEEGFGAPEPDETTS